MRQSSFTFHYGHMLNGLGMTILWIAALFCVFAGRVHAQIRIHRHLTVEDGLVQSQVLSLHKDREGGLWIGTLGGASRWNGVGFENVVLKKGLKSPGVYAIAEDSLGRVFLATNGGGISIFDHGRFEYLSRENGLAHDEVRTVAYDGHGRILAGTLKGLSVIAADSSGFSVQRPLLEGLRISHVVKAGTGELYVAAYDSGLWIFQDGRLDRVRSLDRVTGIRAVLKASDGTMYVSVDGRGVLALSAEGQASWLAPSLFRNRQVNAIFEASDGRILFGIKDGGVLMRHHATWDSLTSVNGLSGHSVWAIAESGEGTIFIGTWDGVGIYDGDRVVNYTRQSGLPHDLVVSIDGAVDGGLWIGTMGGGAFFFDPASPRLSEKLRGITDPGVWAIRALTNGGLVAGTNEQGLLAGGRSGVTKVRARLADERVYCVLEARDGSVHFGTRAGAYTYRDGMVQPLEGATDRVMVYGLIEDRQGRLVLATRRGVRWLSKTGTDTLDTQDGLPDNHVWSVLESADGTLYIGTNSGGLIRWRDGKMDIYDSDDGLSDNTVYAMLEDSPGRLYVATNKGVNVVTMESDDVHIRVLHRADGLAHDECSQGAAYKDRQGCLWFGSMRGLTCIDPRRDRPRPIAPKVTISKLRVFENEINFRTLSERHRFDYNENYLKFDYVGVDLAAPEKVTYRYRMSGVDKDWVETRRTFVQYSSLGDGDFVFELMARNDWGSWSEPLRFAFTISPPYWKTWWFVALVVLGAGGLVALVVYHRVQRVLAIERWRTKIAADFHDSVGAGLSQVHMLAQVALLQNDDKNMVTRQLKHIDDISQSLYEDVKDIIWMINPKKDSLYDLIVRLRDSHDDIIQQRDIRLELDNLSHLQSVRIPTEYRRHLYLIFREAFNNSLKYAQCRSIRMSASWHRRRLRLEYRDDGCGFDPDNVNRGNGLDNMSDRAKALGGHLTIASSPGGGVRITFEGELP